jgi:secreted trypsin-like serine protease
MKSIRQSDIFSKGRVHELVYFQLFVASPLITQNQGVRTKIVWLGVRITRTGGATCLDPWTVVSVS